MCTSGTSSGAVTLNANGAELYSGTLTGNVVLTVVGSGTVGFVAKQGPVGGHTVTFGGQPVSVDPAPGAATPVEFVPVGAGYVVRESQPRSALDARFASPLPVNVKRDHGAVGDGVADDTAAIASASAQARSEGRGLYLPRGHYRSSPAAGEAALTLTSAASRRSLLTHGDGPQATILEITTTAGRGLT